VKLTVDGGEVAVAGVRLLFQPGQASGSMGLSYWVWQNSWYEE